MTSMIHVKDYSSLIIPASSTSFFPSKGMSITTSYSFESMTCIWTGSSSDNIVPDNSGILNPYIIMQLTTVSLINYEGTLLTLRVLVPGSCILGFVLASVIFIFILLFIKRKDRMCKPIII